jgi:hypothetical protein
VSVTVTLVTLVPGGIVLAETITEYGWEADWLVTATFTETVKLYVPPVVGVPVMVVLLDVVAVSNVNPGGRVPVSDHA